MMCSGSDIGGQQVQWSDQWQSEIKQKVEYQKYIGGKKRRGWLPSAIE